MLRKRYVSRLTHSAAYTSIRLRIGSNVGRLFALRS